MPLAHRMKRTPDCAVGRLPLSHSLFLSRNCLRSCCSSRLTYSQLPSALNWLANAITRVCKWGAELCAAGTTGAGESFRNVPSDEPKIQDLDCIGELVHAFLRTFLSRNWSCHPPPHHPIMHRIFLLRRCTLWFAFPDKRKVCSTACIRETYPSTARSADVGFCAFDDVANHKSSATTIPACSGAETNLLSTAWLTEGHTNRRHSFLTFICFCRF